MDHAKLAMLRGAFIDIPYTKLTIDIRSSSTVLLSGVFLGSGGESERREGRMS